jgi:hypothetical protein
VGARYVSCFPLVKSRRLVVAPNPRAAIGPCACRARPHAACDPARPAGVLASGGRGVAAGRELARLAASLPCTSFSASAACITEAERFSIAATKQFFINQAIARKPIGICTRLAEEGVLEAEWKIDLGHLRFIKVSGRDCRHCPIAPDGGDTE